MAAIEAASPSFLERAKPLVVARLLTAGLTFSIPLVLARVLALEEFGTYKQLLLVAQTLYYVLPFGVAQSLFFFLPRRQEEQRAFLGQTLLFLCAASAVAVALLGGLGEPLARYLSNPTFLAHRTPLALYVVGVLVSSPLEVALTSRGRTRAAAAAYLLSDGLRAVAMVAPALLGWGLEGVMWALAAFGLLRLATCGGVLLGFGRGPLFRLRLLREQLAYAAPFGSAMALAIPQQYAHQFAVSGLVPPELFALYAVGCFQLPLVGLLYTPVSEVLMVRMGELEREGRPREGAHCFREATGKLAQAFLPLGAFLFAAAPELISALFGPRFLPAVPLFRIGVLGTVLAIFPVDGALRATNRTRHLFRSYLLKAAVTVPAVYLGVRLLGMKGAIASAVLTEVVGVAALMAALPGAVGERGWRAAAARLIPWRELGWATGGALGAGLGVVLLRALMGEAWELLPEGLPWRFVPLAAAALAFSLAYLSVLWAARQPLPLTRR